MRKDKGSITVFLSLIIVIIMVFIGGLIDGSRMRTAETQVNRAVDNGTKSILASYDKDLKDTYGLFAFSGDEASMQALISEVIKDNLITDSEGNTKYVDLYDYNVGGLSVSMKGPLTQMEVIKEQILQNMKYRAPINLVEGLITKLGLFKDMDKYSDSLKKKEDLDKKVKSINKLLKELEESGQKVKELIAKVKTHDEEFNSDVAIHKFSDIPELIYISKVLNTVQKDQADRDKAKKEREERERKEREEQERKEREQKEKDKKKPKRAKSTDADDEESLSLGGIISRVNTYKTECITAIKPDLTALNKESEKFLELAEDIKEAVEKARPEYEKYKTSVGELGGKTSGSDPDGIGSSVGEINEGFEEELKQYDEIFDDKKGTMQKNIDIIKNNVEHTKKLLGYLDEYSGVDSNTIYNSKNVNNQVRGEAKQLDRNGTSRIAVVQAYDNNMYAFKSAFSINDSAFSGIRSNVVSSLKEIKELIEDPAITEDENPGLKDAGEKLKDKKEDSLEEKEDGKTSQKKISLSGLPSGNSSTEDFILFKDKATMAGDTNSNIETSLDAMDKLGDAFKSLRDKIYINEYVMTRLKDRVVGDTEALAKNRVPKMVSYDFDSALDYEIEYILAGNASDTGNKNNVWWKMYACRVLANSIAIRGIKECRDIITTMAILTQVALAYFGIPSNLTLLKAIYTAGWVANESKSDMDLLVGGHKVPLYKKDFSKWATQDVLVPLEKVTVQYDSPATAIDKLLSTVYSDYLRLFLLIQDQDTTIARIEDIIQVNMKIKTGDEFDINKTRTQVNVAGDVSIKYMFLNLPMMFAENKRTGRYSMGINKSLGF